MMGTDSKKMCSLEIIESYTLQGLRPAAGAPRF
jgi:hypothetical protein